jgi:DNA-binding MarR family transcriptional regulator
LCRVIGQRPGASSHEQALRTFQTDQSFGTLATRLVARGHVRRAPGKGRVIAYELTPAGADLLARGTEIAEAMLGKSFRPLTEDERATLFALLTRLLPTEP